MKRLFLTDTEVFWIWKTIRSAESCVGMTTSETDSFKKKIKRARNSYLKSIGKPIDQ